VTEREEGQRVSRLVGGAVLVLIGGLLFLANLGVIERMRPGDFWPMLLIWVGATRIFAPSRSGHVSSGVLILALGVLFQIDRIGWLDFPMRELWPYFLVAAGAAMILEGLRDRRGASLPPDSSGPAGLAGPGGRS
jgi:hypothetical protein